jgi:hypothetical protein
VRDDAPATESPGRLDRELIELLNELRVALPGVQVLFAFLLTVPFRQRFAETTEFQRDVYFAALMSAAVATAFLITPSAFHRIRFRQRDKAYLLRVANGFAIAGLAGLAVAIAAAVLLVSDFLFTGWGARVATARAAGLLACLWCPGPTPRRLAHAGRSTDADA